MGWRMRRPIRRKPKHDHTIVLVEQSLRQCRRRWLRKESCRFLFWKDPVWYDRVTVNETDS